ncbi:MAG: hypothetical protein HYY84_05625 [Deltaproteobacteria bacterium]|nr:hypothetical protein [Deltaproteobacteria bacterium]
MSEDLALVREFVRSTANARIKLDVVQAPGELYDSPGLADYQLVFLDADAPLVEIERAIAGLKARDPWARVVPIARGNGSIEDEFRLRKLGIFYYLTRPLERDELSALFWA